MNPIEQAKERLLFLAQVEFHLVGESVIEVPAANESGFEVSLHSNQPGAWLVYYNGWHEHFDDPQQALGCFLFGLTDSCRLKEVRRGRSAYGWQAEGMVDGAWEDLGSINLLLFPFWLPASTHVLQNHYYAWDSEAGELASFPST